MVQEGIKLWVFGTISRLPGGVVTRKLGFAKNVKRDIAQEA